MEMLCAMSRASRIGRQTDPVADGEPSETQSF